MFYTNFEKYTMFLNLKCNKSYSSVTSCIIHSRKKEVEDNCYDIFMKVQEDKNLKAIHLERLVETRWSYWHTSLHKIKMRITEILDVPIESFNCAR